MTADCETHEARLPLLRYADELSPEERVDLLDHLEGCAACRRARDEVEAAAASLDVVLLEHPDPERLLALKSRVLTAVADGCPREGELLWRDELDPHAAAHLERHVADCAVCRDADRSFRAVGQALDLDPLPRPAGLDGLKARVMAEVGASPRPRGMVLRLPAWTARAAAALLVAAGLGFAGWSAATGPADAIEGRRGTVYLAAIKRGADELALQGDLEHARRSYEVVVEEGRSVPDAVSLVADAERELRVIRRLEASVEHAPAHEQLQTVFNLVVKEPDSMAVSSPSRTLEAAIEGDTGRPASRLRFDPSRSIVLEIPDELRRGLNTLHRQAIRINLGFQAESRGDLIQARAHYRKAIELAPDTEAAKRARERLSRLG